MRTLLLATTNEGKAIEIRESLAGLDLALMTLTDLTDVPAQPDETGETFEENAIQKALYYFQQTGIPSIADDSGIEVEALSGELGVHTRRWGAGPQASDEKWIDHFLERMKKEENKKASFVCFVALADAEGVHTFAGGCKGVITESLEAAYLPGLPLSACFRPDGCQQVFSALSFAHKNEVSHRGEAVSKLRDFLS